MGRIKGNSFTNCCVFFWYKGKMGGQPFNILLEIFSRGLKDV